MPATIKQIRKNIVPQLPWFSFEIHFPPHLISATTHTSNLQGYKKIRHEGRRTTRRNIGEKKRTVWFLEPSKANNYKWGYTLFPSLIKSIIQILIFFHTQTNSYITHCNLNPDRQSRYINKLRINIWKNCRKVHGSIMEGGLLVDVNRELTP